MQRRPTTQDISWFLDLARNCKLQLSPPYQRRSVWTAKDQRFFLDTIFNGYPCPAIFLQKRINEEGSGIYDVVDGKQRLETILRFADNKISIASDFGNTRLAGKKWKDLDEDERRLFWNYVLPVELLDFGSNETGAVNDAFDRLNRNSRKLEPQELRHARFDGWLISTVESECTDPQWRKLGVVTNARAKRMKDAQFLSELLLVLIERKQFGFDQQHLDEAYAKYDDPDDEGIELDTEKVNERLRDAKTFLETMDSANGCVRAAAATVGAFYTLWALVVLHRESIDDAVQLAPRYASFVALAANLRDAMSLAQLEFTATEEKLRTTAWIYATALQGAHTDFAPRQTRLEALLAAMRVQ